MFKTPFFVSCEYKDFDEYLRKLSSKSRQNYKKYAVSHNLKFKEISLIEGKKYKNLFEELWHKVKGVRKFSIKLKSNTHFFSCWLFDNIIGLQLVEYNENYVYCHMPMYDKKRHSEVAKFMWFNLIKHIIENTDYIGLDMGGTCGKKNKHVCKGKLCNPNSKYIIENREKLEKYKFNFFLLLV